MTPKNERGRERRLERKLNASFVATANSSIVEAIPEDVEYDDFVKRFVTIDLDSEKDIKLIGYKEPIAAVTKEIERILSPDQKEPKFLLLTGPPATGKTTVVRKLAQKYSNCESKLKFFYLKASWTLDKKFGNPDDRFRAIFDEAIEKAPSLIFIDKIDCICPEKRNEARDRVFNALDDKLESLSKSSARILILAATNRPESLDPQIRHPCYFRDEIRFPLPKQSDREEFLQHILSSCKNSLSSDDTKYVAENSHCYLYKDLSNLCEIAIEESNKDCPEGTLDLSCFKKALLKYKPFAVKSITTPCPPQRWSSIGGVESVKETLQLSVIWPLKNLEQLKRLGLKPGKGILLYGPPGCSKTMLARALATESGYNFISIKGPELMSKYVGDSEAAVRKLYRNAREVAPCLIFFDEIDSFSSDRGENESSSVGRRVVSTLLTELDGIEPLDGVFTIAATNRPFAVDDALLRAKRLNPQIYIPLPDERDRQEIFRVYLQQLKVDLNEPSSKDILAKLAAATRGYSGAEIEDVCMKAGQLCLLENIQSEKIKWHHLTKALEVIRPTTIPQSLLIYKKFDERSKSIDTVQDCIPARGNTLSRLMRSLSITKRLKGD